MFGGGGDCIDAELVTYPDIKLNRISGNNIVVAGLIPRDPRKAERGSGHR